jgi:hypothetical protein
MTSLASTLTGPITVVGADLRSDLAAPAHSIGSYVETADGRGFRYAKMGAVGSVQGKVYATSAWDSTNFAPVGGLAVSAQAIGDTTITLTGTLTIAANLLAGGFLVTDVTPGEGYTYRIVGNTAVSSAANCVVTLADPIVVATTTSTKVVLAKHPYDAIVVKPGTASTGHPVGVATSVITALQYGWIQTYGPCAVLSGVATSISLPGVPVTPSAATAGSVIVSTALLPTIGWAMQLFTATEYNMIYLTIK